MLDRDVAAAFLVNRTGDQDRQAARDLADELGGLPLTLEQAAAYIHATGGTLARYLTLFQQRRAELLAQGEPIGYTKTVASTWTLAFDRLQQTAPGAVGLLRLLAFYEPEAIPLPLLLQPRPGLAECLGKKVAPVLVPLLEDQLAAGDAIAALRVYSMVTPAAGGSVSVHRLVQAVTEDQMPAGLAEEWRQAAAALIEAALPDDTASPGSWPVFAALLPHAHAALTDNSAGMAQIANYLAFSGSYAAARDLQRQALDARERLLGPEHPDTLTTRHNFANWTGQAGDPAAARDLYAELLPVRERVLGPEHRHTLANRHSLASSTGEAGDPAAARNLYAELLPVVERVLGPEHRHTLTTRGNLARWTGQAGDPAAARDLYAELLPVRERVLGPEHPDTLTARGNLAGWTGQAGDPAAARNLYAELLPVRRASLWPRAPGHPDRPRQPRQLDRAGGGSGRRPGPVRRAAARARAGPRPGAPGHPDHPRRPRQLDRAGGGSGRRPGPVRRAAARTRADPRPRAPGHPDHPCQPRQLDRGGGGSGRCPGPVRRAAARGRAGPLARSTRTP